PQQILLDDFQARASALAARAWSRRLRRRRLLVAAGGAGVLRWWRWRLFGEHHALAGLAGIDAQHRVAGHADAMADTGEACAELHRVGADREVLGRRSRDVQHNAPLFHELARHLDIIE